MTQPAVRRVANSEEESRAFGLELARLARPGMVIALVGELGTGKTTLAKAVAEGLGVTECVVSPTFTIIKEYTSGRLPLYHFDLYRLAGPGDLCELGFEEYFYGEGVCVVEWADRAANLLPENALTVELSYGETDGQRVYDYFAVTKSFNQSYSNAASVLFRPGSER
jgi:tRNA threonylcarbamoyladenosine biosynthesis protein TsaE